MANKQQVLALLDKGLTPKEIAKNLKCKPEYVRATRKRATPEGREQTKRWSKAYRETEHGKQKNREKARKYYATHRDKVLSYNRKWWKERWKEEEEA